MLEPLSRRTLLRGAGAVFALPFLEAMLPARASTLAAPRRVAWIYVPNGVHMSDWRAESVGPWQSMPPLLAALEPHKAKLLQIGGLAHDKARANGDGPGDHARAAATFLTASQALKTDGPIRAGVSVDQLAAREVGALTRLRSLELGCEPGRLGGQCDNGYSCAYSNSISWSTPQTPAGKEVDPRSVFDRLFRDGDGELSPEQREARRRKRRSVLDLVREDAKRLSSRVGAADGRKLDEYLSGVRELERRIEFAERGGGEHGATLARPEAAPDKFDERARLMCDLLAIAFETDTTRIATLMLANEGSSRSYPEHGVPESHHELSHHGGDPDKLAKIATINRVHVDALRHLLDRLARNEGGESLLDSCRIAYGSGISDGDRHSHGHLPILLAGDGPAFQTGRVARLDDETPCANLWLTMLRELGVEAKQFGDSTGFLEV